jgi:hypothetical protein
MMHGVFENRAMTRLYMIIKNEFVRVIFVETLRATFNDLRIAP